MGDSEDDDLDDFDSLDEELEEFMPPKPTLSEQLLTEEDRQARKEYRLAASICCVNEAWRKYKRVTYGGNAIEPANLSIEGSSPDMVTRMGVLYDPTAGLRMRFLKKKFEHLLDGFAALKQAAFKPYIRCHRPKKMDTDGQGFSMAAVVKAYRPEVYTTHTYPSTFAYKEKWSKTFNSNFVCVEDILRDQEDKTIQTLQSDIYSTKRIRRKDKTRDLTVEKFDLEDIPLDYDGNPIGRSVGICEWCGRSIMPIPSPHTLSVEWNHEALYCCRKYRTFIEEVVKTTHSLEVEAEKRTFLIDPRTKQRKMQKHKQSAAGKKKSKLHANRESITPKTKDMLGKMIEILQEKYETVEDITYQEIGVDTLDLPWDPAETRYHQQQRANAELSSTNHTARSTLTNIDILLGLEEVFTNNPA